MAILNDNIFEAVTVQYSLILPAYRQVVKEARQRNVGVVVMGPLAGGLLAEPSAILEQAFLPDDPVAGALLYVLNDEGVSSVASGMMTPEEVEANCRAVSELPEFVSSDYQERVDAKLRAALSDDLHQLQSAFCSGCRYCTSVCPEGLRPFDVFKTYNMVLLKGRPGGAETTAERAAAIAEACTQCRKCEAVCPQHLSIPEHLQRVKDHFGRS
jgi:predicted aldo/keto reductase-like oxidoreductase